MFADEITAHPEKANADKQRITELAHNLLTKEKNKYLQRVFQLKLIYQK
jgi:hypothetical protein